MQLVQMIRRWLESHSIKVLVPALFVLVSACGGGGSNTDDRQPIPTSTTTGTLSGRIISAVNGEGVANAAISVGSATTTTAADGSYTLTAEAGERVILRIDAPNFAETIQVARVLAGQTTSLGARLLPTAVTLLINVAAGGTVAVPNSSAQIVLPANGLVPRAGGTASGTVNVALTPINPALDAGLMPGDYTAITAAGGTPVPIESFGALLIDIRDSGGARYDLAPGSTATIRIPVGTRSALPPVTIPLFYFDEGTARWIQEGTATLVGSGTNQFYQGTVPRLRNWNADVPMDTVYVSGCVRDINDQPAANVQVRSDGVDYSGSATGYTTADGTFRVAMRRGGLAAISAFASDRVPLTNTVNVGPPGTSIDFPLSPCLRVSPAAFKITTTTLPTATVGVAYNTTLTAANGALPYTWSVTAGALPAGLTLDAVTGRISGTPVTPGTASFTVQAQDSTAAPQVASQQLFLPVWPGMSGGKTLTAIAVTPASTSVVVGANQAFTATGTYSDGSTANITTSVTWASGTPGVATINATSGIATGVAVGTATITASSGTLSGSATLTVTATAPTLSAIAVTPASASIAVAGANQFTVTGTYSDGSTADITSSVTWASGTPSVATINTTGLATGVAAGTTAITAASGTMSGSATLTVTGGGAGGGWKVVSAGHGHTVAIKTDGTLWAWGWNSYGQIGDGITGGLRTTPTRIGTANTWAAVTAGEVHTVALQTDGTLWAWGYNGVGQLGDGTTVNKSTPTRIGTANTWASVVAGSTHTVALQTDGTLWAWGYNLAGQLGDGTSVTKYTPTRIGTANTWASVTAGWTHTVALQTDGTLWAWGDNRNGQLGDGTSVTKYTPTRIGTANTWAIVAAGNGHTVARQTDGTLWAWGWNAYGQLGDGTTVNKTTPTRIGTANTWASVAAENVHTVALQTDGTLWAWGSNLAGQLGDGTAGIFANKSTPTRIGTANTNTWAVVVAGGLHTVALQTDGTLWAWGYNFYGQLGDGTAVNKNVPTLIP
ncbi:MAG: Ig-like domain-containing protein [Gammaproteobacteria bacterium]|nr:Ig-like domain-containing protein [Gammaproteobacteria bacterium]